MLHFLALLHEMNDWLHDILTNFIGALFGFGFALWLYYKQNARDTQKEEEQKIEGEIVRLMNERRSRIDKLNYLKLLLVGVIRTGNAQRDLYKEYVKSQTQNFTKIIALQRPVTNDFKRLHAIDSRGIFEAIQIEFPAIAKDCVNYYVRLNSRIDFINGCHNEIKRINDIHLTDCHNILLEIQRHINRLDTAIFQHCLSFAKQWGASRRQHPEFILLDNAIKQYSQLVAETNDIQTVHDQFLFPLMEKLNEQYLHEEWSQEILGIGKKIRFEMQNLKFQCQSQFNELDKILTSMNAEVGILDAAIIDITRIKRAKFGQVN